MTTLLFSLDTLQLQFPIVFFWIDTFLKASLLILLGAIVHWIYRHQSASAQGLIWLIILTACLCIPVFKFLVPTLELEVTVSHTSSLVSAIPLPAEAVRTDTWWADLISMAGWLYCAGILVMIAGLTVSVASLGHISRRARPVGAHQAQSLLGELRRSNGTGSRIDLLFSDSTPTPFTWGIIRHRLILPEAARNWETGLLRQALAHELGHIQRNDWLFQLLGRLALCFYWPNPLVWHAVNMLKVSSEKACDDAVTDNAEPAVAYASNLLRLVAGSRAPLAAETAAMTLFARPSMLRQRIHHLLHPDRNRAFLRTDEIVSSTVLVLLLVIPFSVLDVSVRTAVASETGWSAIPVSFGTTDDRRRASDAGPENDDPSVISARPLPSIPTATTTTGPGVRADAPFRQTQLRVVPARPAAGTQDGALAIASDFFIQDRELFSQWEATPLVTPTPSYPRRARRNGIEGHVVAEFRIDSDGNVFDTRIIESVPTGIFDQSVLRAVGSFVYCPEIVDGIGGNNQPITKRFSFTLRDRP